MQLNFEKTNGDWERAADAGHPGAQFHLGLMYATGEEIPLDLVLAHKWLNLAATRGSGDATTLRAEMELGAGMAGVRRYPSRHRRVVGVLTRHLAAIRGMTKWVNEIVNQFTFH